MNRTDGGKRKLGPAVMAILAATISGLALVAATAWASQSTMAHASRSAMAHASRRATAHASRGAMGLMSRMHMEMPTHAAYIKDAPMLQPEGWIATASSAAPGHVAGFALDGHTSTYWLSSSHAATQSITLDMRAPQVVSSLTYVAPGGAHPRDEIGRFEVSVSNDGRHFGPPVATGTWSASSQLKQVGFAEMKARFIRLTALSAAAGPGHPVGAASITLTGALTPSVHTVRTIQRSLATSTNPSVVGSWGAMIGFPLIPVAAAMLPDDKMLIWSSDQDEGYAAINTANYTQTAIVNLATDPVTVSPETITNTDHNMFCPGVAILANGDIMVTGGDSDDKTSIYDPTTNTWTAGPNMNIGRGYNGMTLLSNLEAFTLGGSWSGDLTTVKQGEVWSPTGGWRLLPGVSPVPMYTQDAQGVYRADNHGWFIALPDGKVLQAGPSKQMNWITTSGAGSITATGVDRSDVDQMNGNAVYYDTDKVITMGGAPDYQDSAATADSDELTIGGTASAPTVASTPVGSMNYPRAFANSVVLPNGEVVTVGGQTYAVPFSDQNSILNAELWNPATGDYTVMAPEAEPRNYHSTAILLPDGTVFSGGGGLCGTCDTNHPDGQIFSPPYLFNANGTLATRPTITSATSTVAVGGTITVTTGAPVQSFSIVRYGESTHSVDNDQRRLPLTVVSSTANAGGSETYVLQVPADPGVALPGPWMLFALNSAGVPSVAATVMITDAPTAPTNAYQAAVYSDGPALYWPLNDASGPTAADISGNEDTGDDSAGGITYGAASPVEGTSGTGLTLDGAQGAIASSQEITDPTTYSEEMWFNTTTTSGGYLMGFGNTATGLSTESDRQVWISDDGQLNFGTYNGTTSVIESPGAYNDGQWHFVVATEGPDGMNLYVDGHLVGSNTTSTAEDYVGFWRVGGETLGAWPNAPTSNFLAGTISDVAFFDTELSSTQISAEDSAASAPTPTPPIDPPPSSTSSTSSTTPTSVAAPTATTPTTPLAPLTAATTPSASRPTTAQIKAALAKLLLPSGKSARIAALLKDGGLTFSFSAPSAGKLVLDWYSVPKRAAVTQKGAKPPKPILIATATARFTDARAGTVGLRLTAAGRRLLGSSQRLTLTAVAAFTPTGAATTVSRKSVTLQR